MKINNNSFTFSASGSSIDVLLETLFSHDFLKHLLALLDLVVLHTELLDIDADVLEVDHLLLQDVLKEDDHNTDHAIFIELVLIG